MERTLIATIDDKLKWLKFTDHDGEVTIEGGEIAEVVTHVFKCGELVDITVAPV